MAGHRALGLVDFELGALRQKPGQARPQSFFRPSTAADQLQYPAVCDPLRQPAHQQVVAHPVEEFLQLQIYHRPIPFGHVPLGLLYRLMGVLSRPEAVAVNRKVGSKIGESI